MSMRKLTLVGSATMLGITAMMGVLFWVGCGRIAEEAYGSVVTFTDVKSQTLEFHRYHRTIQLTPEQHDVMREALTDIPAPCCSDRSALTCCCECNMAKSWWGLSKHLIADRGLGAEQVRVAVNEWLEFINPEGFSGDVCYTGGCGRPFRENGCGGMNENHVSF
jgi:hypothetical protein